MTRHFALLTHESDDVMRWRGRTLAGMPEICRFFGIAVYMYYADHGVPHFHAVCGGCKISVEVRTSTVHGIFPRTALHHVLEWATLHRAELLANWERARQGKPLVAITPLE